MIRRREFIAGLGAAAWPAVARAQQGALPVVGYLGSQSAEVEYKNVTGFALNEPTMVGKWLELLSEIAPGLKRAALMFNPNFPAVSVFMPSFETAARSLKIEPIIALVHSDVEIETAIIALGREPGGGLVVPGDAFTFAHRGAPIISAAARNNVPAVYGLSESARDGALLSYGPDRVDLFRRAASYVDRILRGANPGDLPVQLPTKFEMVANRRTAKALGLAIPPSTRWRSRQRPRWQHGRRPSKVARFLYVLGNRSCASSD